MKYSNNQLKLANTAIAKGMAFALGTWFIPIPVIGSAACNKAETIMLKGILDALNENSSNEKIDKIFWFFRKKYFLMNLVTFVPHAGATVQLIDVYAMGQFALALCEDSVNLANELAMEKTWEVIEPKIWDADQIIVFYESSSGTIFPTNIKTAFVATVDKLGTLAQGINRVPGLAQGQEVAAEVLREGVHAAEEGISWLLKKTSKWIG